jgi:single-stranded DNA-binding protein
MAAQLGTIQVEGYLIQDPVERAKTANGDSVCTFAVRRNNTYKTKDGTEVDAGGLFNCIIFGKLADIMVDYGKVGTHVLVTGEPSFTEYTPPGGTPQQRFQIRITQFNGGVRLLTPAAGSTKQVLTTLQESLSALLVTEETWRPEQVEKIVAKIISQILTRGNGDATPAPKPKPKAQQPDLQAPPPADDLNDEISF